MQKTDVSRIDWEAVKRETGLVEGLLGEWLVNGEVDYLRGWSYCFAERKAERFGIPFTHKAYVQLQIITRNRVMKDAYESVKDFLDQHPEDCDGVKVKLVSYADIESLIDESERAIRGVPGRNR